MFSIDLTFRDNVLGDATTSRRTRRTALISDVFSRRTQHGTSVNRRPSQTTCPQVKCRTVALSRRCIHVASIKTGAKECYSFEIMVFRAQMLLHIYIIKVITLTIIYLFGPLINAISSFPRQTPGSRSWLKHETNKARYCLAAAFCTSLPMSSGSSERKPNCIHLRRRPQEGDARPWCVFLFADWFFSDVFNRQHV